MVVDRAEEYRRYAEELLRLAEAATREEDKEAFRQIAREWEQMAESVERASKPKA